MKRSRKLISVMLAVVLGSSIGLTACKSNKDESKSTPLSAYTGEVKDKKGRTVYNKDLFYSNQIKQGGPDPQVLDDTARSGYYYLYSTLNGFHAVRSKNLVEWDDVGITFNRAQSEEVKKATYKDLWAPEVIYDSTLDEYLIFFSATPEVGDDIRNTCGKNGIVNVRQDGAYNYNLYLAHAKSPEGPFIMYNFEDASSVGRVAVHNVNTTPGVVLQEGELEGKTWVEQEGVYYEAAFPQYYEKYCYLAPDKLSDAFNKEGWSSTGQHEPTYYGCIDPSPFVDPITGEKILYFKAEDKSWNVIAAVKMKNNSWLTPDWSTFTYCGVNGYYTVEDWRNGENYGVSYEQTGCNEGPHMIYHKDAKGNGKYYLSFSVNGYGGSSYQVGTMVSDSPMGPFRKLTEEEGGLLICSTTTESQTVSGAGHHSYMKVGGQEFIIYHRHTNYDLGGGDRYACVDEMKWLAIEDINGEYLEVPYLNGPTDSLQPLPEKYSDYKNVATQAKVSCSNTKVNASAVNDGLMSVHKTASEEFMDYIPEAKITKTSTFTFKFDSVQTIRSVLVYNSAQERDLFRNVSKIELVLPDNSVRAIKNVKYDIDEYTEYEEEIDLIEYSMSGSAALAEFYDINVKEVRVTVEVPKGQERVGISEIKILGRKTPIKDLAVNEDEYSFVNEEKFIAVTDSDMTIDGKFDEARWSESRWLNGVDRLNENQYANISFTTSYGENGIYFAMKVEEVGTNIYVNSKRASWLNSSIEMYMGPVGDPNYINKLYEFDFMADGSYKSKVNINGWTEVRINGDKMPIIRSTTIGGEVNTPECTGYQIEAFFPNDYLAYAGYDVEHLEDIVLGIDPVHIFSFDYDGTDANQSRYWSQWSKNYVPVTWQKPDTFFKFGKNGLIAHDLNIEVTGKGTVTESNGNDYILPNSTPTLIFKTKNGTRVKKVVINGVELDITKLVKVANETYSYKFDKAVNENVNIEVIFG